MSQFFNTLYQIWFLFFGWMPTVMSVICTVVVGLVVFILVFKIVAFILDVIPFA